MGLLLSAPQAEAASLLLHYRIATQTRDFRVRNAIRAGLSKNQVHRLSGIARTTIDAILEQETESHGSVSDV